MKMSPFLQVFDLSVWLLVFFFQSIFEFIFALASFLTLIHTVHLLTPILPSKRRSPRTQRHHFYLKWIKVASALEIAF